MLVDGATFYVGHIRQLAHWGSDCLWKKDYVRLYKPRSETWHPINIALLQIVERYVLGIAYLTIDTIFILRFSGEF